MMRLDIQALCQKGLVRDNNEDMVSLGGMLLHDDQMSFPVEIDDDSQFCLLIADGMGGHEQGERASQELLDFLAAHFKERTFDSETIEDELCSLVKQFSDQLNWQASEERQMLPMGCTLTGVVWVRSKAFLLNAGDSRTYRFRNGILRQLTQDETPRGITGDPSASKSLLNCIGGGAEGNLVVEDITHRLMDGDMLLICSDGLTDMVPDDVIEHVMSTTENPAEELYRMACQNGGRDNVSIVVARYSVEMSGSLF